MTAPCMGAFMAGLTAGKRKAGELLKHQLRWTGGALLLALAYPVTYRIYQLCYSDRIQHFTIVIGAFEAACSIFPQVIHF